MVDLKKQRGKWRREAFRLFALRPPPSFFALLKPDVPASVKLT